jgi:hypothetical protein
VAQFEAVPPIVAVRSFEGEPLQPVAAVIMVEDIVILTIKTAVVAAIIAAVFIVAVRSQEAALLPEAEAHTWPTAVADVVGSK